MTGSARTDPPRHIRDIAHLYLSRARRPDGGLARLVVAGVTADVIPAFHVANLALAAAARGIHVTIEERSGLPANAGCFLGLDARSWVPHRGGVRSAVSAFARVTFALGRERDATPAHDGLEIVHVPPWNLGLAHASVLTAALCEVGRVAVLYLAESDAEPRPWRDNELHGDAPCRVAYVSGAARAAARPDCAGVFTRWKRLLNDPVPAVARDPASRLARQYADACANLLAAGAPVATAEVSGTPNHANVAFEPR